MLILKINLKKIYIILIYFREKTILKAINITVSNIEQANLH
jgi:hypothetical protein